MNKLTSITLATMALVTLLTSTPNIPDWGFGASREPQAIHIDEPATAAPSTNFHIHPVYSATHHNTYSSYVQGDFIGTIYVPRLNRTVNIYEGETMENMDFGAGRFTFTGLHSGNMGLIGHNRGPAGFFSFVRLLQYGDIITIETPQGTRHYTVTMLYTISETDFTPLNNFGDNRLTLITCVEYQPRRRRVAVAMRV